MLWVIGALALAGIGWGLYRHFGMSGDGGADGSTALLGDGGSSGSGSGDTHSSDSSSSDSGGE